MVEINDSMKKFLIAIMLGALVCASACTDLMQIETPKSGVELTITATQESDPFTKTVLKEDGKVWWKPNDAIGVFFGDNLTTFYAYNQQDAPSAKFVGVVDAPYYDDTYWAVFPPELSNKYTADKEYNYRKGNQDYEVPARSGESINVYLPSCQKGVAGTFDSNYFISVAKSDDYRDLSFYNLCGGLAFCVEHEGINEVRFSGNSGESLAGLANVVMDSDGHPVARYVRNGKTEITLAMKKDEYFIPGEWYYIVMLPTTLSNGYTMTFCTESKEGILVSTDPVEIKRSVFGRLETPDMSAIFTEKAFTSFDIEINGDFSDWDALDPSMVSVSICDSDAWLTALRTLKACANEDNVYVYLEFEDDQILDRGWTPVHIYIDEDNSSDTGGYGGVFTDSSIDWMLEGAIFSDEQFCSYDPALYPWLGPVGGSGWDWGWDSYDYGFANGAGSGNKYEIVIDRNLVEAINFFDTFAIGVDIQQSWNSVGVLPNAACTDSNTSGIAPMLRVTVIS